MVAPPSKRSALVLALALTASDPMPAQQTGGAYEEALARYQECIKRLPFVHHTEGREKLARTGRPEALEILIADYQKPRDHQEHARYTLATLFGRHFDLPEAAAPLAALRKAFARPVDTWLWAQTLKIQTNRVGPEEALAIVERDKNALHRAAAILGLGMARSSSLSAAIQMACADFPKNEADRNALLGAMSRAIHDNKQKVNDEQFRLGLVAYINLLQPDVKLTHTAKVQMARHLQWTLNGPALFVDPESWLELLQRGEVKTPKQSQTAARPRFFGVETDGERFCYVVDMSDSMCKEISPSMKPQGPITGPPRKRPKGVLPDESDLPWHLIKTRFDLAREQLKISLQRLDNDKYFSIVWFGDESGTLDSTKGLIKATKGNVARVIAELDSIQLGKPDPQKAPDGTLRGKTNMHSGLRRAFGLCDKGYIEEDAYVHPAALTDGCDTIFLLSDGDPSWDDFHLTDKDYGEGVVVVDTEYKAGAPRTPNLVYFGPYNTQEWLLADVQRMNAFRAVRMHCIGIGEANMGLLRALATQCHGDVFEFGKK